MGEIAATGRRGRPRPDAVFWTDARRGELCALLAGGLTFEAAADALGTTRNSVAGQVFRLRQTADPRLPEITRRGRGAPRAAHHGGRLRRHPTPKPAGKGLVLRPWHPASVAARPLFAGQVVSAASAKRLLKDGGQQSKLGKEVTKGAWKGMPIHALTLPERATCPRSCKVWDACYGNNMRWAVRIAPDDRVFALRIEAELYALAAHHPQGFVVRLHILGDFFSTGYVALWSGWLIQFPALRVFGYTAHAPGSAIGREIRALNIAFRDRWAIRFSGHVGGGRAERGTEVVPVGGAPSPGAILCPAATGRTECCGTCGVICATSAKTIAFPVH